MNPCRPYRLADNRTNQETEWDSERLCEELKDLMVQDFDMALTCFDPDEITAYTIQTTQTSSMRIKRRRCRTSRSPSQGICGWSAIIGCCVAIRF
jgi:hypothetical protein